MQKKVTETTVLETETETESKRVAEGLQSKVYASSILQGKASSNLRNNQGKRSIRFD